MKKLDWYIIKKYIGTFFYAILLLTVITVIVDLSEKTDDFHKSGLSFMEIVRQYYFGFIPHMVSLLFPLFAFISVIFFTSKMAGRSEIVAIFASGTSFGRMMRPYIACACFLALVLWLGFRYVLPPANIIFSVFQVRYVDRLGPAPDNNATIYFRVDSNRYASLANYDTGSRTGRGFVLNGIKGHRLTYNMRADMPKKETAEFDQFPCPLFSFVRTFLCLYQPYLFSMASFCFRSSSILDMCFWIYPTNLTGFQQKGKTNMLGDK